MFGDEPYNEDLRLTALLLGLWVAFCVTMVGIVAAVVLSC